MSHRQSVITPCVYEKGKNVLPETVTLYFYFDNYSTNALFVLKACYVYNTNDHISSEQRISKSPGIGQHDLEDLHFKQDQQGHQYKQGRHDHQSLHSQQDHQGHQGQQGQHCHQEPQGHQGFKVTRSARPSISRKLLRSTEQDIKDISGKICGPTKPDRQDCPLDHYR